MNNELDIAHLNRLVEALIDSMLSYANAADAVRDDAYKEFFSNRSGERGKGVAMLQAQVKALGGVPADEGTLRGSVRRLFLDLPSAWKRGVAAVEEEMERGENHIRIMFEAAFNDKQLSPSTLVCLQQVHRLIELGREDLERLHQADSSTAPHRDIDTP